MRKIARVVVVAVAAFGAVAGSARAGSICVTSGFPVAEGSKCAAVPADAEMNLRAAPSVVTVSGRAAGATVPVTGAGLEETVPPGVRVWVLGRETSTPGPSPTPSGSPQPPDLCVSNALGPVPGQVCDDATHVLPGSVTVVIKYDYIGVFFAPRNGAPFGDAGIEVRYDHVPPGAHIVVNGSILYDHR